MKEQIYLSILIYEKIKNNKNYYYKFKDCKNHKNVKDKKNKGNDNIKL